jgi:hypothetical protein
MSKLMISFYFHDLRGEWLLARNGVFLARNEGVIISTRDDEYGDKPVKSGGSGCSPRGCKDDEKGIDSTPEPQGEGEEGL